MKRPLHRCDTSIHWIFKAVLCWLVAARYNYAPVVRKGKKMGKDTKIPDQVILGRLCKAVREMLADNDLVKAAPEEFSISTDLAIKMVPYFPEWRVSPEWTRREDEEKRLAWNDEAGKELLKKIRPDIIVHRMHLQDENILVVEAKRARNKDYADDMAS